MNQNIIVLIIIVLAIGYSVYAVVKNIRKKDSSPCGDCNGCDIKKEITKNKVGTRTKDPASCGCGPK
jgi:hypothetical protein